MFTRRTCDNGTNSAVICIRVGLSVVAVQVEVAVVVPVDVEAISGRELAKHEPVCYPYFFLYLLHRYYTPQRVGNPYSFLSCSLSETVVAETRRR